MDISTGAQHFILGWTFRQIVVSLLRGAWHDGVHVGRIAVVVVVMTTVARAWCRHDSRRCLRGRSERAFTILLGLFDIDLQLALPGLSFDVIGLEKETVFVRLLMREQILLRTGFMIQNQRIYGARNMVDALFNLVQGA